MKDIGATQDECQVNKPIREQNHKKFKKDEPGCTSEEKEKSKVTRTELARMLGPKKAKRFKELKKRGRQGDL